MGTCWSQGAGLGVVAMTLGLVFGCGGKYDVGSGDTGGKAGTAGSGDTGSGGSSVSGQGGLTTGGAGGVSAGGSSAGGSVGPVCVDPTGPLPEYTPASPDVVWGRLSRFLLGDTLAPLDPLPHVTTVEWVRERVSALLAQQYGENGRAPLGLEAFLWAWAFEGDHAANVEPWASAFARPAGNFADFFAPVGNRVSFLSSRDFLVIHENSSRRGVWMAQHLLCNGLPNPPEGVVIDPLPAAPNKTRRQTIEDNLIPDCQGCHMGFDPLGFSLEHYDSLGEYRTTENGLPINASGLYSYFGTMDMMFTSIDDLAPQLVTNCQAHFCVASNLLQYALVTAQTDPAEFSGWELSHVIAEFRAHDLALLPLIHAIATTPSFLRE